MPRDLKQMFDELGRETVTAFLVDPEIVRRVGTRRRRVRGAMAAAVAAASVVLVAVMLNAVLPAPRANPLPAAPGTTAPASAPTTPATIPDSALLPGDDIDGQAEDVPDTVLPGLCGASAMITDPAALVAVRTRHSTFELNQGDQFPEGTVNSRIMVFSNGGARQYMDVLRSALASCPGEVDPWGTRLSFAVRDELLPGDDSITFFAAGRFEIYPEQFLDREDPYYAVRVGEAVLSLSVRGWEGQIPDAARAREMRDRAIELFVAWAVDR